MPTVQLPGITTQVGLSDLGAGQAAAGAGAFGSMDGLAVLGRGLSRMGDVGIALQAAKKAELDKQVDLNNQLKLAQSFNSAQLAQTQFMTTTDDPKEWEQNWSELTQPMRNAVSADGSLYGERYKLMFEQGDFQMKSKMQDAYLKKLKEQNAAGLIQLADERINSLDAEGAASVYDDMESKQLLSPMEARRLKQEAPVSVAKNFTALAIERKDFAGGKASLADMPGIDNVTRLSLTSAIDRAQASAQADTLTTAMLDNARGGMLSRWRDTAFIEEQRKAGLLDDRGATILLESRQQAIDTLERNAASKASAAAKDDPVRVNALQTYANQIAETYGSWDKAPPTVKNAFVSAFNQNGVDDRYFALYMNSMKAAPDVLGADGNPVSYDPSRGDEVRKVMSATRGLYPLDLLQKQLLDEQKLSTSSNPPDGFKTADAEQVDEARKAALSLQVSRVNKAAFEYLSTKGSAVQFLMGDTSENLSNWTGK